MLMCPLDRTSPGARSHSVRAVPDGSTRSKNDDDEQSNTEKEKRCPLAAKRLAEGGWVPAP